MLIDFSVSNFLSFDNNDTISMTAGKARKYFERLYTDKRTKLTKCKVILGPNASGKSNLISAFQFIQDTVVNGFPIGTSKKYFRLKPENKSKPSEFKITILCDSKIFCYGFTCILSSGSILNEFLYQITATNAYKTLYERNTVDEVFKTGSYFKKQDAILKLNNYGEDSSNEQESLFLNIINKNKGKMFTDFPELKILRQIFNWFDQNLNISFPESILTGYPYFTNANLDEIADILCALGTGINELKIVEVPEEYIKSKIPSELYNKIVADLEKANLHLDSFKEDVPRIMLRSYKEFYTFEIDSNNIIKITTIEFSHEIKDIYFDLNEESDGTARLLDLIEILFKISDNRIFVIDEIDRCLHPSMTVKIIELFLEKAKNRNTQLIITSHESRLLADEILRNDEICFVNKDNSGMSKINPLEKYQLRADKKLYVALFDGSLNSIPRFDNEKLQSILNNHNI